jgi:hypothetical protein
MKRLLVRPRPQPDRTTNSAGGTAFPRSVGVLRAPTHHGHGRSPTATTLEPRTVAVDTFPMPRVRAVGRRWGGEAQVTSPQVSPYYHDPGGITLPIP